MTLQLSRVCPRCFRRHRPYTLHVAESNDLIFWYKCQCGHEWKVHRVPEMIVTHIGERVTLSSLDQLESLQDAE